MNPHQKGGVPAEARKREDWKYLSDGRWIERIVSTNNGTAYYPALTNRFVWDGKVLLAILDHTNGLVMSFMRGSDLSGSIEGAGGVGGVLAVKVGSAVPSGPLAGSTHFVSYDGNGNVVGLTDAETGENSAVYEYGPFGEILRATGPMADVMPLRFSTMFADGVTREVKYLFRDYRAVEGRWTSRDPIGEAGGENSYVFCHNDGLGKLDHLGLEGWPLWNKSYTNGTFIWTEREVIPPLETKIGQRGHTDLTAWNVRIWTIPPDTSAKRTEPTGCCWRLAGRGSGSATFWSLPGPGEPGGGYEHELQHVGIFHSTWDSMVGTLQSFLGVCLRYKQATCYRGATPPLVKAFEQKAWLENVRMDANDSSQPTSVREAKRRWINANEGRIEGNLSSALRAVEECSAK